MVLERLTDARPGEVLRLISHGATVAEQADRVGVTRQTIARWHRSIDGFAEAAARIRFLVTVDTEVARDEIDDIVQSWAPGGLSAFAEPVANPKAPVVNPDVLDSTGREVGAPAPGGVPYPVVRAPDQDEVLAIAAKIAMDTNEPERLRAVALAGLLSARCGGPVRFGKPSDEITAAAESAARERGRDPGVPASVWQEARENFLGPAPEPEPGAEQSGDIVGFERVPSG